MKGIVLSEFIMASSLHLCIND